MCQKLWKIIRKTYVVEFPCKKLLQLQEYSLQPTTGVTALQIHSGSAQKENNVLKFCKLQKNLCETVTFSLTLQPSSPEYLNIRKKILFRDAKKTAVKKVLKNYQKNVFSRVAFKKFELSNPPTYNYAKTDSAANISLVCFENFKTGLWRNHI